MISLVTTISYNVTESIREGITGQLLHLSDRTEPWFAVIAPGGIATIMLLMVTYIIMSKIEDDHPIEKTIFRLSMVLATTIMLTTPPLAWVLLSHEIDVINAERIATAEIETAIVEQVQVNPDDDTTTYTLRYKPPITMSIDNETLIPENEIQPGLEISYVKYRKYKSKTPSYAILNGEMPKDTGG